MQKVRRLRHWKQRFNKNAKFIFRRRLIFAGVEYQPGDPIPKQLEGNPTKVRRFWESNTIELAEFEAPDVQTGRVPENKLPDGVTVEKKGGGWYWLHVGDAETIKVRGQVNVQPALDEIAAREPKIDLPDEMEVTKVDSGGFDISYAGEIMHVDTDEEVLDKIAELKAALTPAKSSEIKETTDVET